MDDWRRSAVGSNRLADNKMVKCACKNHPDRTGFTDLGVKAGNRYPCKECYLKLRSAKAIMEREKKRKEWLF